MPKRYYMLYELKDPEFFDKSTDIVDLIGSLAVHIEAVTIEMDKLKEAVALLIQEVTDKEMESDRT